ncbi:MAG: hypothetical protein Q4G16_04395 [Cruoricaptor ignavus]|nr:hypothetical protein [Cruoricaptor ignavus]
MKLNITFLTLILPVFFSAQVIIGTGKTAPSNNFVSLEFGTENKGIVLPMVSQTDINPQSVNGTFIFDPVAKEVMFLKNNVWTSLSNKAGKDNPINLNNQNMKSENENAKVSIGKPSSIPGILVLEDTDKAMILPLVSEPHKNIINPTAGTLAYDTKNQMLVVFNGTQWSFWKAD